MYDTLINLMVLQEHRNDANWRTVDCRASLSDLQHGRNAYAAGHIPGAVFADLADELSAPVVQGVTGRHPLPDRKTLAMTFGRLGIAETTQVIAYDAGNGAFAARLWWLLRWLGHASVAVLDGGLEAWTGAGLPLHAGIEQCPPARFPIRTSQTRTVSAEDILAHPERLLLIDARSEPRYRGEFEPIDPVAGHIPGAVCKPFEGNLGGDKRFLPPGELRARYADCVGPGSGTAGRELVAYCGSGVTACHDILALRHAGLPEPALYPGSFSEWIQDPRRPVAR
jgi:thiosulfate/3-mercaptopyruvate sulfurtransferase